MGKFVKRLSAPASSDKHYFSKSNIFYACGYGMPNCTAYAWGRLYEITGKRYTKLYGNAEEWWARAKSAGLETGSTPKLGAIICWRAGNPANGSDGAGHVAVVEEIKSNGDIVTSNSAWKGTNFYTQTIKKSNNYQYSANRPLQGFIYCGVDFDNDVVVEEVKPNPTPTVSSGDLKEGDVIQLRPGCTYHNGVKIPSWVFKKTLYYRGKNNSGIVFSTLQTGAVTGTVKAQDVLNLTQKEESTQPAPTVTPTVTQPTIKEGDLVRLNKGARTFTGTRLAAFVYKRNHVVSEIKGERAVITYGGVTVAAVNIKDLTKV